MLKKTPLHVLVVEDNPDDAELLIHTLRRGGYEVAHARVDTAEEMRAALDGPSWDLIVSDHNMPSFGSAAALEILKETGKDLPFIIVSGSMGEETAVAAMKAGAHDYLMKNNLARLVPVIKRELDEAQVRAEHRRAGEALSASEQRYKQLLASITNYIFTIEIVDGHPVSTSHGDRCIEVTGYTAEEYAQTPFLWLDMIHLEDRELVVRHTQAVMGGETPDPLEHRIIHKNGMVRWVRNTLVPRYDATGRLVACDGLVSDITARKQAEEALSTSEAQYRSTLDNMLEGCQIIGFDWRYRYVNKAAVKHGRCSKNDLLGFTMMEAFPGIERTEMFATLRRCMEERTPLLFENEFVYPDETKCWFVLSVQPVSEGLFLLSVDIDEQKRAKEAEFARLRRVQRQQEAIMRMMSHEAVTNGDFETAVQAINEAGAQVLEVEYAVVWGLTEDYMLMLGMDCFERSAGTHAKNMVLHMPDYPTYLQAINAHQVMDIHDALTDPRTCEFRDKYLLPRGISSMLIAPIRSSKRFIGVICFEHIGKSREWTSDETAFAVECANLVTVTLANQASRTIEASRALLAMAVTQTSDAVMIFGTNYRFQYVNAAFETICGYSNNEIIGTLAADIIGGDHPAQTFEEIAKTISQGTTWPGHIFIRGKDGRLLEMDMTVAPLRDKADIISNYVAVGRDITWQSQMENRIRQTQKMEALATLSSGIAHDFNNILSAMLGYTQFARDSLPPNSKPAKDLGQVLQAGQRATELVRQILTFSRQREEGLQPIQLDSIVKEVLKLLRASLPSTIEIRQDIAPECGYVLADPTQIHQVVMNLCTNAFHAMEDTGGTLQVILERILVDQHSVKASPDLSEGPYIRLSVKDTGCGMDTSTVERIFDPFFTTKLPGKGTGLGLSTAHGIVQISNGAITVYSEPGKGSAFHVYLPVVQVGEVEEPLVQETAPRGAGEQVLIVDDEENLVTLEKRMLTYLGYQVNAVHSSIEALEVFRAQPYAFNLVITDQTMPKCTGLELAKQIQIIRPGFPVILCTGLGAKILEFEAKAAGVVEVVSKPLSVELLARTVRKALDTSYQM